MGGFLPFFMDFDSLCDAKSLREPSDELACSANTNTF